jgi:hypothetical protein
MEARRVRDEALQLKIALEKALEGDSRQELMEILFATEKLKVTEALVNETKIGKTVKSVTSKYNKTDELAKKAQSILKEWTRIAKEEGKNGKSVGKASSAPAVPQVPSVNVGKMIEALSEARQKIFHLLVDSLSSSDPAKAKAKEVQETSYYVEKALDVAHPSLGKDYIPRARTLLINMKKNASLRGAILSGALTPEELVVKPIAELGNEEFLKRREAMRLEEFESKRLDWEKANAEEIKLSLGVDPNNEWIYDDDDVSDDGFD